MVFKQRLNGIKIIANPLKLNCMKLLLQTLSLLLLFMVGTQVDAQDVQVDDMDMRIFSQYVDYMKTKENKDKQEILQNSAEFFIGAPYVAGTLDENDNEKLVVNLREFDCVTYIETVIALANTVESGDVSFLNFVSNLRNLRYRDGVVEDYSSRLHYTSDWVFVNQQKGVLQPIDWQKENVLDTKLINFMSSHRHAYSALKEDDVMLSKVEGIEDIINKRGGFPYLPKGKIDANADKIPHMAMIGFATRIEGLDTTHTGFTYKRSDGSLGFIHASSLKNEVVIDKKSLSDYCVSQKACKGVILMKVR